MLHSATGATVTNSPTVPGPHTFTGINLPVGDSTVTIRVDPEDTATAERSVTIAYRRLSNDARLVTLRLTTSSGLVFDPIVGGAPIGALSFAYDIPSNDTWVSLSAQCQYTTCGISISHPAMPSPASTATGPSLASGAVGSPLATGPASFVVTVSPEDPAEPQQTYTVVVNRMSADTTLAILDDSLGIVSTLVQQQSGGVNATFDPLVSDYAMSLPFAVADFMNVSATCAVAAPQCSITVGVGSGAVVPPLPSGATTPNFALVVGDNLVKLTVSPEDPAVPPRVYSIRVRRMSANNSLVVLQDSLGVIDTAGGFANPRLSYPGTVSFAQGLAGANLTAVCAVALCSITVQVASSAGGALVWGPTPLAAAAASVTVPRATLVAGTTNIVTVSVFAEDPTVPPRVFSLPVYVLSNDTRLASLSMTTGPATTTTTTTTSSSSLPASPVPFVPDFDSALGSFAALVHSEIEVVTLHLQCAVGACAARMRQTAAANLGIDGTPSPPTMWTAWSAIPAGAGDVTDISIHLERNVVQLEVTAEDANFGPQRYVCTSALGF
jgi:hypothetical protein